MRVGITCYPTYGGSGIVATELGLELANRGHEVHFITYANPIRLDPGIPRIHYHEVEVTTYPLFQYPPYSLALASRMAEVAERYRSTCCTCTTPFRTRSRRCWRGTCWRAKAAPAVHHHAARHRHHAGGHATAPIFPITKFSIEQSDGVTAISDYLRQTTVEVLRRRSNDIRVIKNFVNCDVYQPDPQRRREEAWRPRARRC